MKTKVRNSKERLVPYKRLGVDKQNALRTMVYKALTLTGCVLCDEQDFLVLQFDHIPPKVKNFDIARALSNPYRYSLIRVAMELEKCQVLCANCHQKKTSLTRNNWRIDFQKRMFQDLDHKRKP